MAKYLGLGSGDSPLPNLLEINRQQKAAQAAQSKKPASFLDEKLQDAAMESEFLFNAAKRSTERDQAANVVDPSWTPSKEQLDALHKKGYTDREWEELGKAGSQEAFDLRLGYIEEDRERDKLLNDAGIVGLGLRVAAGALDPTTLPLVLLSGGTAGVAKAGKLGGAVRGALAGMGTEAATEAILMQGDTQRDWEDVMLSGLVGGAIGGGVGAVTARRAGNVSVDNLDVLEESILSGKPLALPAPKVIEVPQTLAQKAETGLTADLPQVAGYLPAPSRVDVESASVVAENNLLFSKVQLEARQAELDKLNDQLVQITGNPRIQEDLALMEKIKAEVSHSVRQAKGLDPKRQLQGQLDRETAKLGKLKGELGDMEAKAPVGRGKTRAARQSKIDAKRAELEAAQAKVSKLADDLALYRAIPKMEADLAMLEKGAVPTKYRERFKQMQDELRGRDAVDEAGLLTKKGYVEDDIKYLSDEVKAKEAKLNDLLYPPAARGQSVVREKVVVKKDKPEVKSEGKVEEPKEVQPDPITQENAGLFNVTMQGKIPELRKTVLDWANTPSNVGTSVGARLSRSVFSSIKGLNAMINNLTQGGLVGKHSAAVHQMVAYNRAVKLAVPAQEAVEEMFSRAGIGKLGQLSNKGAKILDEFNNQVVLCINGIAPKGRDADLVQKAADSLADVFEDSLMGRKLAGVRGFEHIEARRDYWSFQPRMDKMQAVIGKLGAEGKDRVIDTMAGAYMNGHRLSKIADKAAAEKIARKIAEAQVERTMLGSIDGVNRVRSVLDNKTRAFMAKHMEEAGISKHELDEWFKAMEAAEDKLTMSNRAKTSFGADIKFELNGIRVVDLINTDMDVAMRYAREASADTALAKNGIKSRYDIENLLEDAQMRIQNSLNRDLADGKRTQQEVTKLTKQLHKESQLIRDSVTQLYGESLEVGKDGKVPQWVNVSRQARGIASASSLQWNGFASIPEIGNVIVKQGLFTVLRNFRKFKVNPANFNKPDPILDHWQNVIGAYGHTEAWYHGSRKSSDVLEELGSEIGTVEKGIRTVGETSQLLSFFKHIQHGWEELNIRSMVDTLDKAALSGKVSGRMYKDFALAGMEADELDEVLKFMKSNRRKADGFDTADVEKLPYHLRDKLGAAMLTQLNRAIQKQFIGETPEVLNREWGRVLFQFLTFPVVAYEKQLAYGIKHDIAGLVASSIWQAGLAYMSYMAYSKLKAEVAADKEEYIENAMKPSNIIYGTLNRMGGLGSLTLGGDLLATFGLMPKELMSAPGQAGATSLAKAPAAVSTLGRVGGAAKGLATQGYEAVLGDDYDEEEAAKHARSLMRSIPIVGSATAGVGFAVVNQLLDRR